jgi:hypothetical protein
MAGDGRVSVGHGGKMRENLTVDVGGASVVVAREERVERCHAVVVGRLHAAERGALKDRRVLGVAHAGVALHANVDALRPVSSPLDYRGRWGSLTVELELQIST